MNQKEKMRKDLIDEIDGYFMDLVYLEDMMRVEEDIEKNSIEMNNSPNFTLIVRCALSDSYMMTFMKLYDKSQNTKTIPNLIDKCKKNISLFQSEKKVDNKLKEFEKKLEEDEYIVDAIKVLRHRRDTKYAHNDSKYFGKKILNDKLCLPKYKLWILNGFTREVLEFLFSELSCDKARETKYDEDLKNLFIKKSTNVPTKKLFCCRKKFK